MAQAAREWLQLRLEELSKTPAALVRAGSFCVPARGSFSVQARSICCLVLRAGSLSVLAPSACWLLQRAGSFSVLAR